MILDDAPNRCTRPDCPAWDALGDHDHLPMPDPPGTTRLDLIAGVLDLASGVGPAHARLTLLRVQVRTLAEDAARLGPRLHPDTLEAALEGFASTLTDVLDILDRTR